MEWEPLLETLPTQVTSTPPVAGISAALALSVSLLRSRIFLWILSQDGLTSLAITATDQSLRYSELRNIERALICILLTTHYSRLRAPGLTVDHYSLPSRKYSDHLVKNYWTSIHPLYPFLDKAEFERCYSQLWIPQKESPPREGPLTHHETQKSPRSLASDHTSEDKPDTKIFHCLLNMVFALGCESEEFSSTRFGSHNGEAFWQRCKYFLELDLDVFNTGSLQLVQVMLLMGLYLQTTNMTGACWNIVGIAVRLAQGLGLYLPSRRANRQTPGSRGQLPYEMDNAATRWRVWAGCLFLERRVPSPYSGA